MSGPEARLDAAWRLTLRGYVVPVDPAVLAAAAREGMDAVVDQRAPEVKPGAAPRPDWPQRAPPHTVNPIETALLDHLHTLEARPGLDADRLSDAAIAAMTGALDPHSKLEQPGAEAVWDKLPDTAEHYRGLGFQVRTAPAGYQVTRLYQDSPAARAGFVVGDVITKFDGTDARSLTDKAFTKLSHGDATASVAKLDVDRQGKRLHLAVPRNEVSIPRVEARVVGDVAVLRLNAFTRDAGQELRHQAARLFAAQPAPRGLVLDLRGNLGGLISEAEDAAGLLLPNGAWLATFWSVGHPDEHHVARAPAGLPRSIPVVVLIDADTASAAEVLAAALRDHGRATLIGTRSFGKGISQGHQSLPDGRTLVATGWFLRRPSGAWLQSDGLVPDLTVAGLEETYAGHEATLPGALRPPAEIETVADRPPPASTACLAAGHAAAAKPGDPQLLAAVAVLDCQRSIAPVLEARSPVLAPDGATRQSGAVAAEAE
ncbi:MAG TPA: S41 family peptidase [Aliidongia sp.]|uniref:S41 family peptidase n=1 Tax=Aliidongia sp. TaxID=1914230 RepID=UPI002DDC93B6|nr:S41 family peptidase [Aliidongia sp.]HEV2675461.1 S41 family peptidase [Aliidongia sp.]